LPKFPTASVAWLCKQQESLAAASGIAGCGLAAALDAMAFVLESIQKFAASVARRISRTPAITSSDASARCV
jgi:hypothetical protein